MKKIWLSIPLVILLNSGCSATFKGMQMDAVSASNWTHQQIDNTRRIIHNSTRE